MRLTKEEVIFNNSNRKEFSHLNDFLNQEQKELIEYKTIEEELGIDLITLFKALKNGIYWKGKSCFNTTGVFFEESPCLNVHNNCLINITFRKNEDYVYFKDYGKTWALTREELE